MNTTYDELAEYFIANCEINPSDLPKNDDQWCLFIANAIKIYNNKVKKYEGFYTQNITADEFIEELNVSLNDDEILVVAHIMKLVMLKNSLSYFASVWSTFTKELGVKNFNQQVSAKQEMIDDTNRFIDELIQNTIDTWEL